MAATPLRSNFTIQVPQPVEYTALVCTSANVLEGAVVVINTAANDQCSLPSGADTSASILGIAIYPGLTTTNGMLTVMTSGNYPCIANGTITAGDRVSIASSIGDVKTVAVGSTAPGASIVGFATESATNGQRVGVQLIVGQYSNGAANLVLPRVRCVASATQTLATALVAGQTIDGVTLAAGDRVLLANQTSAGTSGVYLATAAGAASLAPDYVQGAVLAGQVFEASEGTVWANSSWKITAAQVSTGGAITVGTTDPIFMPRTFKATVAIGTPNTTAWVTAATSPIALNDTTSSTTGTKAVLVAGRGTGTITLTGTGTDSVNCGVFNWG